MKLIVIHIMWEFGSSRLKSTSASSERLTAHVSAFDQSTYVQTKKTSTATGYRSHCAVFVQRPVQSPVQRSVPSLCRRAMSHEDD